MKKANYTEKGITLVALVVTIIILLILAGITLAQVLGENGLILKSKITVNNYESSENEEENSIKELANKLKKRNSIPTIFELREKGNYLEKETTAKDSDGNIVIIPAGFKVAADSGDNVTEGIVIEDDDIISGIGKNRGNQYVWIPVSNIDGDGIAQGTEENLITKSDGSKVEITLARYTFDTNGKEKIEQLAKNYTEIVTIANYYQELPDARDGVVNTADPSKGLNATAKNLKGFIDSALLNKGYYIGRYEASYGVDGKPNSKVSDSFKTKKGESPNVEGCLWNNIFETEAAKKCRTLYGEDTEEKVNSDLINSYAFDTAISYIQKFSDNPKYSKKVGKTINTSLTNTGTGQDEICKINEIASNCTEYATEYCNYPKYPTIGRGSDYLADGRCADNRVTGRLSADEYRTFRVCLYL